MVNIPNPKPNWHTQYNLGYVIINGQDTDFSASSILYRSAEPILTPTLDWETCTIGNSGQWSSIGLTPMVVFIEGWRQIGKDQFLVFYQGCDSVMGTAMLTVTIN